MPRPLPQPLRWTPSDYQTYAFHAIIDVVYVPVHKILNALYAQLTVIDGPFNMLLNVNIIVPLVITQQLASEANL